MKQWETHVPIFPWGGAYGKWYLHAIMSNGMNPVSRVGGCKSLLQMSSKAEHRCSTLVTITASLIN